MTRTITTGLLLIILISGCKKEPVNTEGQFIARIESFDLNCSNCIVSFPFDSHAVKDIIGESPENRYKAVNLNKGSFEIGQLINATVRKASENEEKNCIGLYAYPRYQTIHIPGYEDFNDLMLNDTIILPYRECFYDCERENYICFDSLLTDSRCPIDVQCFWAGTAGIRLIIQNRYNPPVNVDLYLGTRDKTVDGYEISFLDLYPYPVYFSDHRKPEKYSAKLVIRHK
jgi:hypothetical protein